MKKQTKKKSSLRTAKVKVTMGPMKPVKSDPRKTIGQEVEEYTWVAPIKRLEALEQQMKMVRDELVRYRKEELCHAIGMNVARALDKLGAKADVELIAKLNVLLDADVMPISRWGADAKAKKVATKKRKR